MGSETRWDHRWFGIWKESGQQYSLCPSVYNFINLEINKRYDIEKLVGYLDTGHEVATTSRLNFPCIISGRKFDGPLTCRTDGVWLWWDDLSHYIKEHGLYIPSKMLENIEFNGYRVPPIEGLDIRTLDWPSL